ncbi:putative RNA-binding protein [Trypanosoma cruzi]|uniref:RNA-binding protein, putative n=2 Tax=Trypanosoma cruzi TaxID=5693 RepID=Q4D9W1_TRYCC|nr:RNA-binding protein, putative [Trypanosoma cruzi]EAN89306.1 RNA-binding protein, putative [Trypanosoma cruzi]PWV12069.1 putative RNA-binding protein [Trypanosoma cruzi]|eukprot:XP_811157.1 RNA-binding protein [Trypanosoma cruzi strain CL Brener]
MDLFFGNIVGDGCGNNYIHNTNTENFSSIPLGKTNEFFDALGVIGDERECAEEGFIGGEIKAEATHSPPLNSCATSFLHSITSNVADPRLPSGVRGGSAYDEGAWMTDVVSSTLPMTTLDARTSVESSFAAKNSEAEASVTANLPTVITPKSTPTNVAINSQQTSATGDTMRLTVRNNVYVSELPAHWNTDKLRSVCSAFGTIISAKVVHDGATNKSREYGFVMFETEEQAALCVESLNNCSMAGRVLACRLAHEKAMPAFAHAESISWSPCTTTNATPSTGFITPQEGPIESGRHFNPEFFEASYTPPQNGQPNSTIDQNAYSGLRKSRNVFIQGLPLHWNTDKLRGLCGTCGRVLRAKVVRDATTSLPCGHGFVLFETEEQAAACVATLNGFVAEGRTLTCRLTREKRSSLQFSMSNADGLTTTPGMPPLSPSGRTSVNTESLVTPSTNVLAPIGIVEAVATPQNAAFMSVPNYGKWPPVGMVPNCAGGALPQTLQHAGLTSSPSFLGHATLATPQSYATVATAGSIPGFAAQPTEYGIVPGMEGQFASLSNVSNAYIITLPYSPAGMGQVTGSNSSLATVALAATALPLPMGTAGNSTGGASVVPSELVGGYIGRP